MRGRCSRLQTPDSGRVYVLTGPYRPGSQPRPQIQLRSVASTRGSSLVDFGWSRAETDVATARSTVRLVTAHLLEEAVPPKATRQPAPDAP